MVQEELARATPTQLRLHHHYQEIHDKFFPPKPHPPLREISSDRCPMCGAARGAVTAPAIEPPPPPPPPPPAPAPVQQPGRKGIRVGSITRDIIAIVAQRHGFKAADLLCDRRFKPLVHCRHIAILMVHLLRPSVSLPELGRRFGGRDHTTILNALRKMQRRIANDLQFAAQMHSLECELRERMEGDRNPYVLGRYVQHHRVEAYLKLGWCWARRGGDLSEHAALMVWLCQCEVREP